jgi:peroxiredoxin
MAPGKLLAVGEIAPDFELRDSTRKLQRLSSLTAQGPLVLLFYRGYW